MIEKQAWLRLDVEVKNTDYRGRPGSRWGVVRSGALIGRKSVLENTDDERWCGDSRRGQMERQELRDEIQSPHSAECQGLASKSSLAREANGCFILLIFSLHSLYAPLHHSLKIHFPARLNSDPVPQIRPDDKKTRGTIFFAQLKVYFFCIFVNLKKKKQTHLSILYFYCSYCATFSFFFFKTNKQARKILSPEEARLHKEMCRSR